MKKGLVPIAGVSKLEQAKELVGIYKIDMSEEDFKYLEEPYHSKDIAPRID